MPLAYRWTILRREDAEFFKPEDDVYLPIDTEIAGIRTSSFLVQTSALTPLIENALPDSYLQHTPKAHI